MRARVARARLALALLALTGAACELLTHATDYAVAPPYQGICNVCPDPKEDLRHVPCPTTNAADGDDGTAHVYAARRLHFGKPSEWKGPGAASFRLGFDQDCSARPNGLPVLCTAVTPDGGAPLPWVALPHGIDDSLLQRIFTPLYEAAAAAGQNFDLDATYSANEEAGKLGLLVTIEGWNGTPDDAHVTMTLQSSPGVTPSSAPPLWNGDDPWDVYPDTPELTREILKVVQADGYVAGGVLVVDYRSRGDVSARFGVPGQTFRILLHEVVFSGTLTNDRLDELTMSARADVASAYESITDTAKFLGGCNPAAIAYLEQKLPALLVGAADMPSSPNAPKEQACDSVSFAWALDAERARLGGTRGSIVATDGGCL